MEIFPTYVCSRAHCSHGKSLQQLPVRSANLTLICYSPLRFWQSRTRDREWMLRLVAQICAPWGRGCIINNKWCAADLGMFARVYRLIKVDRHRCAVPMYMVSLCNEHVWQVTSTVGLKMRSYHLTRLPSKQQLRWLRTRKPLAYQESTCINLIISVTCPYEMIVYSVLKHIITTRMTIYSTHLLSSGKKNTF